MGWNRNGMSGLTCEQKTFTFLSCFHAILKVVTLMKIVNFIYMLMGQEQYLFNQRHYILLY